MEGNRSFLHLEILVRSAEGLPNVNYVTAMNVYAEVSINGEHRTTQRTPVHWRCGSYPNWNSYMMFTVDGAAVYLLIQLKSHCMLGDRDIGTVQFSIKELIDRNEEAGAEQHVSYFVRLPNGSERGILNFSYKFKKMFNRAYPPPAMSYPGPRHPTCPAPYTPPVTSYPWPNPGHPPAPPAAYPPPPISYQGPRHPTCPAPYTPNPGHPPAPPAAYPPPGTACPRPTQGYPTPPVQTPPNIHSGFGRELLRAALIAIMGETTEQIYDQYSAEDGFDFGPF